MSKVLERFTDAGNGDEHRPHFAASGRPQLCEECPCPRVVAQRRERVYARIAGCAICVTAVTVALGIATYYPNESPLLLLGLLALPNPSDLPTT